MKILVVFGTRPEVIKLAPVIRALEGLATVRICSTGQHGDMMSDAMRAFALKADVDLAVMRPEQPLNLLTARIIEGIDPLLAVEAPDWVLVQGDTTTAFAAGLAAFHRGIQVGHVEAGLRTRDLADPFPEEANRAMIARFARLNFAPTEGARQSLIREGIDAARIVVTGNTVVDAMNLVRGSGTPPPGAPRVVLITCHRREALPAGLVNVCKAVSKLCGLYPQHRFVFPVHPNPQVREPVFRLLRGIANLDLIDPLPYRASLDLLAAASLVITDSGGLQEEAPSFGVPVVVIREHTERPEGIAAGFATLAGLDAERIQRAAGAWLDDPNSGGRLKEMPNPYGDGQAAQRIADVVIQAGRAG
jgi:UDP-N-acetylglucosamine 2-epimerase (non-hydrolysing)